MSTTIVSKKSKIREMDAEELQKEWDNLFFLKNCHLGITADESKQMKAIEFNYLQLTGKSIQPIK